MIGWQRFEQRELHLGAHEPRVALRKQHRAARAGGVDRERTRIDHARTVHRVDVEPPPREIDERDPRDQLDVDPRGAHQLDAALGDRRAAGNRVDDLAAFARRLDDAIGDRRVDRVEVVGAVVEQVERLELDALAREIDDRGVARRSYEADRHALERRARGREQQIGAGRAEPDHHDAASAAYGVTEHYVAGVGSDVVVPPSLPRETCSASAPWAASLRRWSGPR